MNIFITGIAGFLGSNLAHNLIKQNHKIFGNDNLMGGYEDNLSNEFNFYNVDCCDFNEMKKILKNMDIVVHCAATAYEGLSVFSPSFVTKNVFEASVSTFSAAVANNVKKIIYCSSMARYGAQDFPFREDMQTRPQDPYGIAKVASENVLKSLCDVHGVDWTILVPHNIVGPRQKYDDPYRNVLSIFLNRMLLNKPAIIYGDGLQKRCFSYVDDCISCIEKTLFNNNTSREIINIGPDEEFITILELADKCANVTGFNGSHTFQNDRPQEVKFATCSSEKARKLIDYKTKFSLDQSIQLTYEYIKNKGPKDFDYKIDLEINNSKTPDTWKNKLI